MVMADDENPCGNEINLAPTKFKATLCKIFNQRQRPTSQLNPFRQEEIKPNMLDGFVKDRRNQPTA
jgi:hypothetical protein